MMRWCRSHRFDPAACRLADRHYNRQTIGAPQCAKTGSCLVLVSEDGRAYWITSWQQPQYVKHAWPDAWENSAFRREGGALASELIRQAVAATLAHYGDPPALGMITMIDRDQVRPTMVHGRPVWGWTYRKAGFVDAGETEGGLLVLQLWPADMPARVAAKPRSMHGAPLFDGVAA
jgi:hypothetical protein